jgi:hypothetical protein
MNTQTLQKAFLHSGFKYLKVELEAQVNPEDYGGSCEYCDEGRDDCGDCEGTGEDNDEAGGECSACSGRGYFDCQECSGGYNEPDWDTYCEEFESRFRENLNGIDRHFRFLRTYHDGSVDTECTFTLRVDYLDELPDIIKAFRQTCLHFGSCVTENAGLHITLLEGYKYPRSRKLNQAKLSHYKKQVSKLLLGLVYLGSEGEYTRGFGFRDMRISAGDKYSAIFTHNDTCLEYRLFDTCYNEPERVFKYLALIVKTLKYYTADPQKSIGLHESVSDEASDRMLKKHKQSCYRELTAVYDTRQGRRRLFQELFYLVDARARRVLADIATLQPCLMSAELFTIIKQY